MGARKRKRAIQLKEEKKGTGICQSE